MPDLRIRAPPSGQYAAADARFPGSVGMGARAAIVSVRSVDEFPWRGGAMGTETFVVEPTDATDLVIEQVDQALLTMARYRSGDLVVIAAGGPQTSPLAPSL